MIERFSQDLETILQFRTSHIQHHLRSDRGQNTLDSQRREKNPLKSSTAATLVGNFV